MRNSLYYGDNLSVLRESIPSESVDLIYLDPPFNSNASYNVLFKDTSGKSADAQIEAFKDTWHWGEEAESAFSEVLSSANTQAAELLRALRSFLGENDVMAYLAMMAVRLLELHRVLKPTGSLYLHCDPTASHYLKLILDAVFCAKGGDFKNEIIWHYKRWPSKSNHFQTMHDVIFFYIKQVGGNVFNTLMQPLTEGTSKRWQGQKSKVEFIDGVRQVTQKTDEKSLGVPQDDVWDMPVINSQAKERLGYPTQKPIALLERIISASSKEGDVVLDPFCGCGTTVHAAQKLNRRWIGIDITHLAISLIERRLKDAFPGIAFDVHGTPQDLASAQDLARRDKYQFQWWAVSLVEARPYGGKKKGADGGIDGILFFRSDKDKTEKALVSVKGGDNVGVVMVRDLIAVVEREKAAVGVLISLALPTKPMEKEAAAAGFFETPFEKVPKIQIITLAELFQGKRPRIPRIDSAATFNAAVREKTDKQTRLL